MLAQQLILFERCGPGVDDHVILVINDALEIPGGHVENQADAGGHALEEPNVTNRHRQFDMAHALTANAGERHLDAAAIANDAAMLDAFVFAAGAFPVFYGTENTLAEQSAFLGFKGAVVDGLRVFDFPLRPRTDGLRRRDLNGHVIHLVDLVQTE